MREDLRKNWNIELNQIIFYILFTFLLLIDKYLYNNINSKKFTFKTSQLINFAIVGQPHYTTSRPRYLEKLPWNFNMSCLSDWAVFIYHLGLGKYVPIEPFAPIPSCHAYSSIKVFWKR